MDAIWIWQEGTLWVPGQWICTVQDVVMGEVPGWLFWNANGLPWKGEERRRSREASKMKEGLLQERAEVWKESMETSVWRYFLRFTYLFRYYLWEWRGTSWAYVHCVHTARFPILCEVWWPPSKPWAGKMAKPFILYSIWVILPVHSLERGSHTLYIMWYLPQQHQYFSHIVTQALKLYDQG